MNLEPIIESEVTQRNINIIFQRTYSESKKMILKNFFIRQQWRNRHRDTFVDVGRGEEKVRCMESNMETYITICKVDS